ncbi:hypothetical protein [Sphingomonas quercus]|uniref:DUF883 family protein n=1 Tax=Sphingomonas quercus TaxID=2842451 RepID=A0ABS6BFY0_9SPHN|nr:hypothetical protein [Sphingomonas quercus]MBU3076386.1 hypothetical protein [Sphingomonas quercus]
MPNRNNELPEGTDSIIAGASATDDDFTPAIPMTGRDEGEGESAGLRDRLSSATASLREQATERTADLRGQAGDRARAFAEQGKERATTALEGVSRMIGEAAGQVDEKVGREYGDYARRAQAAIEGLATTLRDKDVDALFDDARDLVKKSPAIAIGAAAVVGFALVRLIKSGTGQDETATADTETDRRKG